MTASVRVHRPSAATEVQALTPGHGRLPWPLPALLVWSAAWGLARLLAQGLSLPAGASAAAGLGLGTLLALAWPGLSRWRRMMLAAGYPVALLGSGLAAGVPAWVWLLPALLLLLAYPLRAWRDAPLFPTPPGALAGLAQALPLAEGARVLDAGCGLGQGLVALRGQWPQARLSGVEWSLPLAWATRLRCPWAQVRRGDLWAGDWSQQDVVYVFQRPESMARAWAKACAEMAPGSWLVSLDFAVPGRQPTQRLQRPGRQSVWLYRLDGAAGMPNSTPGRRRR